MKLREKATPLYLLFLLISSSLSILLLYAGFIRCFALYFQVFTCLAAPGVLKGKETFSTCSAHNNLEDGEN